jgi:hypothetical protein
MARPWQAVIVAILLALSTRTSVAQNGPCGAFSCEYNRYMENQRRELDSALLQEQMRQQRRMMDEQLADQQRQLDEMRRRQSVPSPYPPCSLRVTGSLPCDPSQ